MPAHPVTKALACVVALIAALTLSACQSGKKSSAPAATTPAPTTAAAATAAAVTPTTATSTSTAGATAKAIKPRASARNAKATSTPSATPAGAAAPAAGTGPASCAAIPVSVFAPAAVTLKMTFPTSSPAHLSCEFASADATAVFILNMGPSTAAAFATLMATTAKTETVTPLSGLGASAFTITKDGKTAGVETITSGGLLVSLGGIFTGDVRVIPERLNALY